MLRYGSAATRDVNKTERIAAYGTIPGRNVPEKFPEEFRPPDPERRSPAATAIADGAVRFEAGASRSSYHKFYGEPIVDVIKAAVAPQQSAGDGHVGDL